MLPFLQAILGETVNILVAIALLAGVIKLFQVSSTLNEVRDLLTDIKHNTHDFTPPRYTGGDGMTDQHSTEAVLRTLND